MRSTGHKGTTETGRRPRPECGRRRCPRSEDCLPPQKVRRCAGSAGGGRLDGVPAVPEALFQQIPDFKRLGISVSLHGQAGLADHASRCFELYGPQAKPVLPVSASLAVKPGLHLLRCKGMPAGIHHSGILQNFCRSGKACLPHLPQNQPLCCHDPGARRCRPLVMEHAISPFPCGQSRARPR